MSRISYEEACDRGYDGPSRSDERRGGGCGGWSSWDGPCGAPDCDDCYPGHEYAEDDDEGGEGDE